MNPNPVAWMNKNHEDIHIAITQEDYNRQPTFIQKQWEGSAPLFTLDQLNQARADALREAVGVFQEHYDFCMKDDDRWVFATDVLRRMADEIDGGRK